MDKENLDIELLLSRFKTEPSLSPADASQKLLMALFFMVIGLILIATGFISLLLRLLAMVHLPIIWLVRRLSFYRFINTVFLRCFKHSIH